jgi:hypothetical protein
MVGIDVLWLPILLSAVIVFIASSIIHMAPLWHKNDYPKLKNEEKVREAIRPLELSVGDYIIPRAESSFEMRSPEFTKKMTEGPVLMLSVWPNEPPTMGKSLTLWFLYCVVVGIFAAYIAGRALPSGTDYLQVFRFAGCTAFLGYTVAQWQQSIWWRRPWGITIKHTLDGLIYALLTAGVFGWLWPR